MDDCLLDIHPYRMTNTKCRIDTIIYPYYGHIVARNMYRKEIKTLIKIVHQFGFIYKIIQGCSSTKHKNVQTLCSYMLTVILLVFPVHIATK